MTNYKPTNFSYFLEKYPFNVIASIDSYPLPLRPADPELNLDKAMTILGVVEEQMEKIISPVPFMPTDFGFKEVIAEGDNEHQQTAVYISEENRFLTLEAHPTKAMTYIAIKEKDPSTYEGHHSVVPEFNCELFLPNQIVGRIVLQSIGFLPLLNPPGYYEKAVVMPNEVSTEPVREEVIDTSIPVHIWPFMKFDSKEEAEKFNASLTGKNLFLSENPIAALNQVRSLHQVYKEYTFVGVEEAVQNHPVMTDEQKKRALESYIFNEEQELEKAEAGPSDAEIAETKPPVLPCSHCNGTGKSGVDLNCLWCDATGRDLGKVQCRECSGTGEDHDSESGICIICKGSGMIAGETK